MYIYLIKLKCGFKVIISSLATVVWGKEKVLLKGTQAGLLLFVLIFSFEPYFITSSCSTFYVTSESSTSLLILTLHHPRILCSFPNISFIFWWNKLFRVLDTYFFNHLLVSHKWLFTHHFHVLWEEISFLSRGCSSVILVLHACTFFW